MHRSTRNVYVSYAVTLGILVILIIPIGELTLSSSITVVPKSALAQISNSTGNATFSSNTTSYLTYKDEMEGDSSKK
jgi:hypothetical protein